MIHGLARAEAPIWGGLVDQGGRKWEQSRDCVWKTRQRWMSPSASSESNVVNVGAAFKLEGFIDGIKPRVSFVPRTACGGRSQTAVMEDCPMHRGEVPCRFEERGGRRLLGRRWHSLIRQARFETGNPHPGQGVLPKAVCRADSEGAMRLNADRSV